MSAERVPDTERMGDAGLARCSQCGGTGMVQDQPTIYCTDSDEEICLAYEMARMPCGKCRPRVAEGRRNERA